MDILFFPDFRAKKIKMLLLTVNYHDISTKHKNGRIYIQVVDKSSGKYNVFKSFGSSLTSEGVLDLKKSASIWINEHQETREIDFTREVDQIEQMLRGITQLKLA